MDTRQASSCSRWLRVRSGLAILLLASGLLATVPGPVRATATAGGNDPATFETRVRSAKESALARRGPAVVQRRSLAERDALRAGRGRFGACRTGLATRARLARGRACRLTERRERFRLEAGPRRRARAACRLAPLRGERLVERLTRLDGRRERLERRTRGLQHRTRRPQARGRSMAPRPARRRVL